MPAPAAAVVKNSRLEVTLYFLSDDEEDVVVLAVVVELEELPLSEEDVLLVLDESEEDLAESFFSEELSPLSFLLGLLLPLLA